MSVFKKYSLLIFATVLVLSEAKGQGAQSPFSTFGIGDRYDNALVPNQGMAGVGLSNPQAWYLNNQNPALLVFNSLTIFEVGLLTESRTLRGSGASEQNKGGNLNYLATAFPVLRRPRTYGPNIWTTSLGLMPYTNVDYKLEYHEPVTGIDNTVKINEEGTGGLTQLYWSNGVRLSKTFAVGLKASYIFSSVVNDYSNTLDSTDQLLPFRVFVKDRTHVKDFAFTAGVSYSKDSIGTNNRYRFSAGLVYTLGNNLKAIQTSKLIRTADGDTTALQKITLLSTEGNLYIPQEIAFGISYARKLKWSVGTDFSYQDWSKFRSINKEDEAGLTASWKVALGAEYTPDIFAPKGLLKRMTYRTGVAYEKCPFLANGKPVKDIGINFGFSLPTGRSSIDVALKVGKRGNKAENLLEESYFKLFFGITFNDQWFIKRKFD